LYVAVFDTHSKQSDDAFVKELDGSRVFNADALEAQLCRSSAGFAGEELAPRALGGADSHSEKSASDILGSKVG
jgi:hypothetical protein